MVNSRAIGLCKATLRSVACSELLWRQTPRAWDRTHRYNSRIQLHGHCNGRSYYEMKIITNFQPCKNGEIKTFIRCRTTLNFRLSI